MCKWSDTNSFHVPLENSGHQSSLIELKLALLFPAPPEYNVNPQKFLLHWNYVTGMWERQFDLVSLYHKMLNMQKWEDEP